MGKFHPHGDQAIYDALVRLAQDFAQRYPLVDGQGNFGNIDGDNAGRHALHRSAADRSRAASARRHRRGRGRFPPDLRRLREEPVVLPAAFPNLLANGSQGIAVGMATSIPPHNAAELCDAALHLIDNAERAQPHAAEIRAGPGFPDRRHHRRSAEADRRSLHDRPRLVPGARALEQGGHRPRHLPDRRHRDSLAGAEGAAGREDRRAAQREEAAAGRRRARRIGRGHPPRDRAARAHGRCRAADGVAVQAHRAREPHSAQHERAGEGPHPEGASASPRRCANGSTTAARCWCGAPSSACGRSSIGSKCSAAT